MKIEEIIDQVCKHEISKHDALEQLTLIFDKFRKNGALEFTVEEVGSTVENNHGIIKLKLPYEYIKIKGKIKIGDKVEVIFLP